MKWRIALLCLGAAALAAESYLSAPASLKVDGIPPIPASLAEKIARYGARDVARLMNDAGIVRNWAKIGAAIHRTSSSFSRSSMA